MRAVEPVAVIHHGRDESEPLPLIPFGRRPGLQARAGKDGLARIRIADPFVERENARELVAVGYFIEQKIGNES
ncbi:MAG TPA: hypothetical protein VEV37_06415 [Bryobacteraceae bacterium]|jgi:hypothetical protein|nr:hypothetical protein [Bryobacteraceae bacterium]